ncbi:MAG: Glu/Leu/Phe/Val dehydrogenase [Clostridia bacterium]|jgi:glutamate dehydrogenase|nr:Glu/Leu/Phe/Val dehydrogenase [Clostridia bacterium]
MHDEELMGIEHVLCSKEPDNVSSELVKRAGERLGYPVDVITQLIQPDQVLVFRLPVEIFGKVISPYGCIVLHNNARGPYKGGIRMANDVDVWETSELARLMSLKTAIAGIEFGGGKSGIKVDMNALYQLFGVKERNLEFEGIIKRAIIAKYATLHKELLRSRTYVPAPDMGTGGPEMAVISSVTGEPASVTGKPEGINGWLAGRREATGYGVATAVLETLDYLGIPANQAKIAMQGFGNVGSYAALYLAEQGVKLMGVVDIFGGVQDPNGLDVPALFKYAGQHGTVKGFNNQSLTNEELFKMEVDVLIPAAGGHVLNKETSPGVNAKAVVSAANMPATPEGMAILEEKQVYIFPDIVANSGGVVASNLEYAASLSAKPAKQEEVLEFVGERIKASFQDFNKIATEEKISPTEAAIQLAVQRIYDAMKLRGQLNNQSFDLGKLTGN